MPCAEYNGKLFMRNPYLKNTRALFNSREEVEKLRSDLEKASEEKFKEIDEARRKSWEAAHHMYVD